MKKIKEKIIKLKVKEKALSEKYQKIAKDGNLNEIRGTIKTLDALLKHSELIEASKKEKIKATKATEQRLRSAENAKPVEIKKTRIPKYIKIGDNKIITPKEIVLFHSPLLVVNKDNKKGTEVNLVYGDKRCSKCNIPIRMKTLAYKEGQVIIVLRIPKRKTGNMFAFSQDLKTVMSYRKWRLANAHLLFAINQASNKKFQTVEQFIRSEAEFTPNLEIEALKAEFLALEDPKLIVKDIKRLIHLYYQDTINNENAVSNKHSKGTK